MYHYNGSAWAEQTIAINSEVYGVGGSHGSDVFAVAGGGKISHYNGSAWSAMASGTFAYLHGIWVKPGTDAYVVGSGGEILHYSIPDEYGDSCPAAQSLALNTTINGSINSDTDADFLSFSIPSSGTLTVYTTGTLDTVGSLKNSSCTEIATNDDVSPSTHNYNFSITQSVTAGAYFLSVTAYRTGAYTLHVEFTPGASVTTTTVPANTTTSVVSGTTTAPSDTTTSVASGSTTTSLEQATTTTTAPGGLCPAKKVLGEDNPKLENLRALRDGRLAQSAVGRRLIQIYYTNADSITAAIDRSPALRAAARRVLEAITR